MGRFGESAKVNVSEEARAMYDGLIDRRVTASIVDLFHLSAAIGIVFGERRPIDKQVELLNVYTIDKENIFSTLLEEMHPELSPEQRLGVLLEHAEIGIRYLQQQYEKYGTIDWPKLVDTVNLQGKR
jgi:hypothetical protein